MNIKNITGRCTEKNEHKPDLDWFILSLNSFNMHPNSNVLKDYLAAGLNERASFEGFM